MGDTSLARENRLHEYRERIDSRKVVRGDRTIHFMFEVCKM